MKLLLERKWPKQNYTIGKLHIDGKYFCETLEDHDRGLTDDMSERQIKAIKVYAQTAIPKGRYKIEYTISPKFGRKLPRLQNVKGFSGILIHPGNTANDSAGCILVGYNTAVGRLSNSRKTSDDLNLLIEEAINKGDEVWIEIK